MVRGPRSLMASSVSPAAVTAATSVENRESETRLLKRGLEGHSRCSESVEDLGDGVNVSSCPQIETKVVLHCSVHNVPGCPLHGVIKAGVDNVLLRGSSHLGQDLLAGADGDGAPALAEPLLQR